MNANQRRDGETFNQFKARRLAQNNAEKNRKDVVLWDSYRKGTYKKAKHGLI
jgi:hypothetical protein